MNLVRSFVDPRSMPTEFDDLIDWFDRISLNLVLLEEYRRDDVHAAVQRLVAAVGEHSRTFERALDSAAGLAGERSDARALLRSDHVWFAVSLEQLEWFYRIVDGEDHSGHRQALGQYGRVLAESLRRHRDDERVYLGAAVGKR